MPLRAGQKIRLAQPDTPLAKAQGVLPSAIRLITSPLGGSSRGQVSRSVSQALGLAGSRVPLGTVQKVLECFMQDIQGRIMITIKYNSTTRTDMCPNTEGLFDDRATVGTLLARVLGRDCNHGDIVQERIAFDPLEEGPPSCIMDRFGKLAVTNHVPDLKVFIGNQVARRDQRVCLLSGKIFTLPLNLQMLLGQSFLCFLS